MNQPGTGYSKLVELNPLTDLNFKAITLATDFFSGKLGIAKASF